MLNSTCDRLDNVTDKHGQCRENEDIDRRRKPDRHDRFHLREEHWHDVAEEHAGNNNAEKIIIVQLVNQLPLPGSQPDVRTASQSSSAVSGCQLSNHVNVIDIRRYPSMITLWTLILS